MRAFFLILVANVSFLVVGCGSKQAEQPKPPAQPQYMPEATIKDIMDSIVDPNADFLWDAIATRETLGKGVSVKAPHTDEDWEEVRHHAIALVEATNLLLIPGRKVAQPGEKSENPNIELGPDEIQPLIDNDRAAWEGHARALHDSAMVSLKAIEAKSVQGLLDNGDKMDTYCEGCHVVYWYPKDKYSKELYQDSLRRAQEAPQK
jgi:hypothetical protein